MPSINPPHPEERRQARLEGRTGGHQAICFRCRAAQYG
jgi:hypothetical protein